METELEPTVEDSTFEDSSSFETTTTTDLTFDDPAAAADAAAFSGAYGAFVGIILVFTLVAMWKMFVKAGKPGWAAIIPIYNIYVLLQIVGRPFYWILLLLIPFVNIIFAILLAMDVAKAFGKSGAFGFFLNFLLSPIGYLVIGFGSAQYVGPGGTPQGGGSGPGVPTVNPAAPVAPAAPTAAPAPTTPTPPAPTPGTQVAPNPATPPSNPPTTPQQ